MTRRITLELGQTTGDVWCEDCPHADPRDGVWKCDAFGDVLFWHDDEGDTARLAACRAAEVMISAAPGQEPEHETALDVFEATRAMRGRATAAVLGAAALPATPHSARLEQIGKLVMELWGTTPAQLRWSADHRAVCGTIDPATADPQVVQLLRGVADILEKP